MTPSPALNPRIAIAQLQMHWTIEANMASIVGALELASGRGASICTFPELALTGFHREIVSLARPELVAPEVRRLQDTCARLGIAAAVGAPTFGDEGGRFNSHLFIDRDGQLVSTTAKIGLNVGGSNVLPSGRGPAGCVPRRTALRRHHLQGNGRRRPDP